MGRLESNALATSWPKEDEVIASAVRPNGSIAARNQQEPTFDVGDKTTPSLVTTGDVRAHLELLGAFKRLRNAIMSPPAGQPVLRGEDAWIAFVGKAVRRTELWIQSLPRGAKLVEELPPPDVLYVWVTYVLNPRKYYEDGSRWNQHLLDGGDFPLHEVVATLDPNTLYFLPAEPSRVKRFEDRTGQPFLLAPLTREDTVHLACPFCNQDLFVQLFDTRGSTGFAQPAFQTRCHCSERPITLETLGMAKFAADVAKIRQGPEQYTLAYCYANPRYGLQTPVSQANSLQINKNLLLELDNIGNDTANWSFEDLKAVIGKAFTGTKLDDPRWVDKTWKAYSYGGPFSVDLRAAINRQLAIINLMDGMGWSAPAHFDNDDSILVSALIQYHRFLDLVKSSPSAPFVPTFSIDAVWHTHLFLQLSYRESMLELLGMLLDHDDDIDEDANAPAFESTAEVWKARFGIPYSFGLRIYDVAPSEINKAHAQAAGLCGVGLC